MDSEKTKCEVHNLPLKKGKASISYGLPIIDKILMEAERKLFPNSKEAVWGGCTAGPLDRRAEVLFCSECRKAEKRWRKKNGRVLQKIKDLKL